MDVLLLLSILAISILALVAWNVIAWPKVSNATPSNSPSNAVSILIPARNEERNLPGCLDAALRQDATVAEILVYDDHSTDATASIVRDYAQRDPRVRLVPAVPLADGWCGKNFACAQLAQQARSEWMLFLDADARLTHGAAKRMATEATRRKLTFLSCWPGLTLFSFWERVLMPLLNFTVFTLFPAPLSLLRQDASLGLAHGACLLMHRATYHELGGHGAVRDQIFEDTRLAQLWRERGKRGLCLDGQDIVHVRMYDSLGDIWRGFQKNFFPAFRHETSFWAFLALHASTFLAPFFLIFVNINFALVAGLVLAMRALLAIRFRHSSWSVLLHPLGEAILIGVGLSSWWRCKTGKGVAWKGRVYQSSAEPVSPLPEPSVTSKGNA
ncbi:MAG TPA: glycosyltransferase family 2 protein [Blastocatellia bacterium]|nr:glycosyltransferase family 2 protein [Blastocatellia bacterium]